MYSKLILEFHRYRDWWNSLSIKRAPSGGVVKSAAEQVKVPRERFAGMVKPVVRRAIDYSITEDDLLTDERMEVMDEGLAEQGAAKRQRSCSRINRDNIVTINDLATGGFKCHAFFIPHVYQTEEAFARDILEGSPQFLSHFVVYSGANVNGTLLCVFFCVEVTRSCFKGSWKGRYPLQVFASPREKATYSMDEMQKYFHSFTREDEGKFWVSPNISPLQFVSWSSHAPHTGFAQSTEDEEHQERVVCRMGFVKRCMQMQERVTVLENALHKILDKSKVNPFEFNLQNPMASANKIVSCFERDDLHMRKMEVINSEKEFENSQLKRQNDELNRALQMFRTPGPYRSGSKPMTATRRPTL